MLVIEYGWCEAQCIRASVWGVFMLHPESLSNETTSELFHLFDRLQTHSVFTDIMIIDYDGFVVAHHFKEQRDLVSIAINGQAIFETAKLMASNYGNSVLLQLILKTCAGYLLLADFGGGLLLAMTNSQEFSRIVTSIE
jgi:predicted regulator of Ras-like GTPase activity (Roadblock/LC7/MglB family)